MTTDPHRVDACRTHANHWLVPVVGLAAALVILGAWVVVDQTTGGGGGYPGRDDADRRRRLGLLERRRERYSFAVRENSVIRSIGAGETYAGVKAIRSPVTGSGEYATTFARLSAPGYGAAASISVFQSKDGKIVRQWNFVLGQTAPFDNAVSP